ncbi:hypothetical protein DPMN_189397 [Dreissena polymorpha]|uniref:Uncharacterized protein n=1 Tax=Dreissena polymorpha TaxID=45954 RepID=A0A9D4DSQ3_DREPO|nr:hypothetical protein DPMN_189397 [Dreissena polymorpha]
MNRSCFATDVNHLERSPDIIRTNLQTKFHEDWTKMKQCPAPWRPYFLTNHDHCFKLCQAIIRTNVLTKNYKNWTKNVTLRKNAPPHVGHIFRKQKPFHKDLTIKNTSREFAMTNALN